MVSLESADSAEVIYLEGYKYVMLQKLTFYPSSRFVKI